MLPALLLSLHHSFLSLLRKVFDYRQQALCELIRLNRKGISVVAHIQKCLFAGIAYPFFNVAGAERDSIFPNITNDLLNFMVPALIGKKD